MYQMKRINWKLNLLIICISLFVACTENNNTEESSSPNINAELSELKDQIISNPYNPELYMNRAQYYLRQNETHIALKDINKAIELDSTNYNYRRLRAKVHFGHENFHLAIKDLEFCHNVAPEDSSINLHLAKLNMYVGKYEEAFKHINGILKVNVHHAEAYFLKGYAYKELKDTNRAMSAFQTAVEQNPDYYEVYMQMGLLSTQRYSEFGEDYFNNALRIHPESKEALYGLGVFQQRTGQAQKAIKTYRKIILLDNQYENAFYNIGYIYIQLDSIEKAKRFFNMCIEVAPYNANAFYNRGICNEKLGNFDAAKKDFNQAIQFNNDHELANEAAKRFNKE